MQIWTWTWTVFLKHTWTYSKKHSWLHFYRYPAKRKPLQYKDKIIQRKYFSKKWHQCLDLRKMFTLKFISVIVIYTNLCVFQSQCDWFIKAVNYQWVQWYWCNLWLDSTQVAFFLRRLWRSEGQKYKKKIELKKNVAAGSNHSQRIPRFW